MTVACRGGVWLVDLGLAAKSRPCLVMTMPTEDSDRALVTVVPHTTALRGSRFEVTVSARYLKAGGFDAQGIVTIPAVRLIRRLGVLASAQMRSVEAGLCLWLGIGFL